MTRARDLAAFVSNADGDIKFDTDTLFIDSSTNNVGIGTSTPNAYTGYSGLTLNHATNGGLIDLEHNGTLVGEIFLTDVNTFTLQALGSKVMNFSTNSVERMRIDGTGNFIFNEGSNDADFRIESNGEANMFSVDGAANSIGIGETGLAAYSSAWGSVDATRQVSIHGSEYGVLHLKGDINTNAHFTMGAGDNKLYGAYDAVGGKHHIVYISNTGTVFNDDSHDLDFRVEGNNNANGIIYNADDEVFGVFTASTADSTLASGVNFKRNGRDSAYINIGHHAAEGNGYSYMIYCYNGGQIGGITQNGTTGISFDTSSDYRLKENVDYTFDATSRLKELKPARFNFIAEPDRTIDGFLAHEVQEIVPQAITGTKDEVDNDGNAVMQSIDHSKLVPLLVKTIQELEARITALEAE